jgi:hypothetical protein
MAAKAAPARTAARHQSLHFVGMASWSDERGLAKVHGAAIDGATQGCENLALQQLAGDAGQMKQAVVIISTTATTALPGHVESHSDPI